MRFKKTLILVACLSLFSACATPADAGKANTDSISSGVKFSPIAHARTAELIDFIATYPDLTPELQKDVFEDVTQALGDNKNDIKLRIQQSAMLSLPNSEVRDSAAAQPLLQALLDSHELNASDTGLVQLLLTFTLDHNKQLIKVRDSTKKNELLRQRNKALVQKLDDLKNIEKTMIERNAKSNSKL